MKTLSLLLIRSNHDTTDFVLTDDLLDLLRSQPPEYSELVAPLGEGLSPGHSYRNDSVAVVYWVNICEETRRCETVLITRRDTNGGALATFEGEELIAFTLNNTQIMIPPTKETFEYRVAHTVLTLARELPIPKD